MQAVPKSTQWARENKDKVRDAYLQRKGTLHGKLTTLITSSRQRCRKSGHDHEVDTAFLLELYGLQEGLCALSGKEMTIQGERGTYEYWHSISLDRIDSSRGYTKDNVQLVCTGVNYMKKDMNEEDFVEFCRCIVEVSG